MTSFDRRVSALSLASVNAGRLRCSIRRGRHCLIALLKSVRWALQLVCVYLSVNAARAHGRAGCLFLCIHPDHDRHANPGSFRITLTLRSLRLFNSHSQLLSFFVPSLILVPSPRPFFLVLRSWIGPGGSTTGWRPMSLWRRTTSWSSWRRWAALRYLPPPPVTQIPTTPPSLEYPPLTHTSHVPAPYENTCRRPSAVANPCIGCGSVSAQS